MTPLTASQLNPLAHPTAAAGRWEKLRTLISGTCKRWQVMQGPGLKNGQNSMLHVSGKTKSRKKVTCACESQQTPGAGYLVRDRDRLSSFLVPANAAQGDLHTESRSTPSRGCQRAATLGALRKQSAGFLQRGGSLLPVSSPVTSAPRKVPPGAGKVRR